MGAGLRRQITIQEVLEALAFGIPGSVYKIMPGVVTAYHPGVAGQSPPTVDVQPTVNDVRLDPTSGELEPEAWPVLPSVPLAMPKFGGFTVSGKMVAGDGVLLLSFDLDPTGYRATGNQSDPIDTRRHGGGHWVALPFDISDPGAIADPGDDLVIGQASGVQIRINGANISLGSGAADFVALASKTNAAIKAWGTWAAAGTGSGYVPPTVGTKPPDPDVGSTLVKSG